MLKRKNILKVILCISLVCLSVSLIFSVNYFINNLDHKNENKIVNDNNVNEQENPKDEIQDNLIVDDNQEENKNDKVDNNQTNIEKENNNSSNTNSIPKQDSEKQENEKNDDNKIENNKPSTDIDDTKDVPNKLITCTIDNKEYAEYLENYKKNNPTYVIFDTFEEAKSYGEYAMKMFGYGYEQSSFSKYYSNDVCEKNLWNVRLYVSAKECDDNEGNGNPMIWINATSKNKLKDVYDYLREKGYNCGTRHWSSTN